MPEPSKYTATVISMGANASTGLFEQYLKKSLPPLETLEECITSCHFLRPVYREHWKAGAMPSLLKIESEVGLVVLVDIDINTEKKGSPVFTLLWRDILSQSDQERMTKALKYNEGKSKGMVWDATGAAENEHAWHQVEFLKQMIASATYVEPYSETIKLVYKVEGQLGKSTSKVRDLEESLGL